VETAASQAPSKGSILYDPKVRGAVCQVALIAIVAFLLYEAATNAKPPIKKQP
jgi:general L-amino acid transport system permease protein